MSTQMILDEVRRLPKEERVRLAEEILQVLKERESYDFSQEAEQMRDCYLNDKELTVFTNMEGDTFHEYTEGDLAGGSRPGERI